MGTWGVMGVGWWARARLVHTYARTFLMHSDSMALTLGEKGFPRLFQPPRRTHFA